MNTGIVTKVFALAALFILGGCATNAAEQQRNAANPPLIGAADFDAMINIEVRALEPAPEIEATLAAVN